MKNAKSLPAILIAICTLFACVGVFISTTSIANVAGEWAPIPQTTAQIALDRRSQEAQVTATYIAVLASEVVSDTENTHAIARTQEQTRFDRSEFFEQALALGGVFGVACAAIGGGVWIGGRGVGAGILAVRRATLPLPLTNAAHLLSDGRIVHIGTGMTWSAKDDHPPNLEHAQAVRELQSIVPTALISAVAKLMMANANKETKLLTDAERSL